MLKVGQSLSVIARSVGVSWNRVRHIKSEMDSEIMLTNSIKRKIAREDLKTKVMKQTSTPSKQNALRENEMTMGCTVLQIVGPDRHLGVSDDPARLQAIASRAATRDCSDVIVQEGAGRFDTQSFLVTKYG